MSMFYRCEDESIVRLDAIAGMHRLWVGNIDGAEIFRWRVHIVGPSHLEVSDEDARCIIELLEQRMGVV